MSTCVGLSIMVLFSLHTRVYVCNCSALRMYIVCTKGRPKLLGFFFPFWWRFLYCPGSCGHGAHSWCCGCPLRRGEIKADARCHKGACLVLFNSPKLWHGAKAAPRYGKHSIAGTATTAQSDTVGETEAEKWKKTFPQSHTLGPALAGCSTLDSLDGKKNSTYITFFRISVLFNGGVDCVCGLVLVCVHLCVSTPRGQWHPTKETVAGHCG